MWSIYSNIRQHCQEHAGVLCWLLFPNFSFQGSSVRNAYCSILSTSWTLTQPFRPWWSARARRIIANSEVKKSQQNICGEKCEAGVIRKWKIDSRKPCPLCLSESACFELIEKIEESEHSCQQMNDRSSSSKNDSGLGGDWFSDEQQNDLDIGRKKEQSCSWHDPCMKTISRCAE